MIELNLISYVESLSHVYILSYVTMRADDVVDLHTMHVSKIIARQLRQRETRLASFVNLDKMRSFARLIKNFARDSRES